MGKQEVGEGEAGGRFKIRISAEEGRVCFSRARIVLRVRRLIETESDVVISKYGSNTSCVWVVFHLRIIHCDSAESQVNREGSYLP